MAKREIVVELQLSDRNAVAELGKLQTETRQYQQSLKLLNSIVDENGKATNRQKQQIGELIAKIENNRVKIRELKNDLSGATDAGLRFRDKMAEATVEAIKQSGILGKLDAQYSTLQQELTRNNGVIAANEVAMKELRDEFRKGELTAKEYKDQLKAIKDENARVAQSNERLEQEIKGVTAEIGKLDKRVEDLTADLKAGRITTEEFKKGIDSLNKEIAKQGGILTQGVTNIRNYFLAYAAFDLLADKVVSFSKEIFELSGNLEKVDARNRAIAGESLPAFEEAAKKTAIGLGLTERQYVSLASNQKLVLSQLGLEGRAFDDLSTKIVEYADLLGDFSAGELTTEQATQLLNDALLGKTKGLKELGINVKASKDELDALKAEIMANQGVTESQAEALANLELVFRATSETAGQFSTEQLNLDKATDIATARIEQAKETIAKELTPVFILGAEAVANLTDRWGDLAGAFGGIFESGASVTDRLKSIFDVATRLIVPLGAVRTAIEEIFDVDFTGGEVEIIGLKAAAEELSQAIAEGDKERIAQAEARFNKERALNIQRVRQLEEERQARIAARDAAQKLSKEEEEAKKKKEEEEKAIRDKTKAVKELTQAEKDLAAAMAASAEEPVTRIEPRLPSATALPQDDETLAMFGINPLAAELLSKQIDTLAGLREEARLNEIQGIRDLNLEKQILEAEFYASGEQNRAEYNARIAALDDALIQQQIQTAGQVANVFGALSSLYEQDSAQYKAFATIQALINTYMGAALALTDKTMPTFARIAAASAVVISGLASVKKIQGFEEGGYTSKRPKDTEPVGVVHANEYVVPAPILRTSRGRTLVDELEKMRMGHPVRYAPPFVSGGGDYTYSFRKGGSGLAPVGVGSGTIAQADLARTIANMPAPVVSVNEINRVQRRVNVIESLSST